MFNRGILAGVYGVSAVLGLATLFLPVESITGIIGLHFTFVYAIFLLVGSIGCLIGIARPNYRIELAFLWFVMGGYLFYDIALWGLFAERIGVIDGLAPPFGPALAVLALTLFCLGKIFLIQKRNRQLVKAVENDRLE